MRKHVLCMLVLLLSALGVMAQDVVVTGKVVTANNEPLPGVSVTVKGTTKGTATDGNGAYTLKAPSNAILTFNFIGYIGQEITVGNRTTINVTLKEDALNLEQVVVIGYGTQKKKDITTSVVTVSTKDISERPIVSVAQAMQGKAAGVQVTQPSGKPGAGISVHVRGSTSVQSGNEPLYVVDGVQTTDISNIDANDIESMQVLKDASSAAIYGAQGANGVVIITTKKGVSGGQTIKFSTYAGFSKIGNQIDVLNTQQYKALMAEIPSVGALDPSINSYTNWNDQTFGTGSNQNYQLSISGGDDKTKYYISGGYLNDKGIVNPAKYSRYSFRVNVDNQTRSWLKLGANLNYSRANLHNTTDNESSGRGGVIMSALNTPPFLNIYKNDNSGWFDPNPFQPSWENPVAYMEGPSENTNNNRLLGNATAEITFVKNLSFKSNFGIDARNHQWDYYLDGTRTSYGRQENGIGRAETTNDFVWLSENTLNYNTSWSKNTLSALGGFTVQESNWKRSYIDVKDFPKNTGVQTTNVANQINSAYNEESEWGVTSFLGRVMYNWDSKYLITANFRADGSSKLSPQHQWGYFPSVSAGWRLSEESFFPKVKAIDDLKLRASWGKNGNVNGLADYAWQGKFSTTRRPITNPLSGPALSQTFIENKDLTWETTTQTNIGLDLAMFNSRISFTADAYIKKTDDLLLNVPLPSTTGYNYILRNSGKMENKGLEFSVSSANMVNAFKWNTDFNISFNRNKVTELQLAQTYNYANIYSTNQSAIILKPGLGLGTFYGYVANGVDPQTGAMNFKDLNGNGFLDPDDRTVIGSAQPDFTYGLTNNFSYKNFGLSIFFQGSQGNDIYNATRVDLEGMYDSKNQSTAVLNRWTKPGQITDIPKAGDINNARNSTRFVEDGSYLRLKTVTLSYNLPTSFIGKANLKSVNFYVTGQNLLTFTKYSGFDPEVNAFGTSGTELGIDYGTYPQTKSVIFGVNVEF